MEPKRGSAGRTGGADRPGGDKTSINSEANKLDLRNEIQEKYRSRPAAWFNWVFDRLDLHNRMTILEMGSGTGMLWKENRARLPKDWTLIVSDPVQAMVSAAQENLQPISLQRYLNLDGQSLPFSDGMFDLALAIGVLDQTPHPQQVIDEAWRVLRPAGRFITSAGGQRHLEELQSLLAEYIPEHKAETLGGEEERFGLENGSRMLSRVFQEVVQDNYEDQLVFSEVQPILDYVLSEDEILNALTLPTLGSLVQRLKEDIQKYGQIEVTIQKALFTARKKITG